MDYSLVTTLYIFISGLDVNQDKSMAYWNIKKKRQKPKWTKEFRQKWVKDGELAKLLGVVFGLNLNSKEVDAFMIEIFQIKHRYQSTFHFPLTSKAIVINSASAIWFFIKVWGGTKKTIKKCKTLLKNFQWGRNDHHAIAKVDWEDCCAHKNI